MWRQRRPQGDGVETFRPEQHILQPVRIKARPALDVELRKIEPACDDLFAVILAEIDAVLAAERAVWKRDLRDEHHLMPGRSLVHKNVLHHQRLARDGDVHAELFAKFPHERSSPALAKLDLAAERAHALDPPRIVTHLGSQQPAASSQQPAASSRPPRQCRPSATTRM
ncbi:hypothetical protein M2175_001501 [Bradyrhizobium elkanii]|uniref:Uncharacterized protein n=1 Tax=Bradyrhizobium japonicum TaxID=375 RepID=A0A1L3F4L3_BRAJP|nr:hypothetical protein BKD09_07815 [Bradyrhizobium japonicum]MCS3926470.1 hypothetical protein [Bradyrhizobium elkanii]MCS3967021.1 hypothetical protein [Bradyrhizobium japonicum]